MWKVVFLLGFCLLCAYATAGLGFANVNVDDDDVVTAADYASQVLSKRFAGKYHHKLGLVIKARKQVVSGSTTYFMDIIVGQTNCEKKEVDYENVEDCEFRNGISTYKKCTVTVYKDLNGSHKLMSSGCMLASKKDLEAVFL